MKATFTDYAARLRGLLDSRSASPPGGIEGDITESRFNELAIELFALQFNHNRLYRKLCEARSVSPSQVSNWQQLPAVPAAAFKELELTSLPEADRIAIFHSSGTTEQQPSRHLHNAQSLDLYEASVVPWFQAHLWPAAREKLELVFLAPPPSIAPHSSLVHMLETIRRQLGAPGSQSTGALDGDGGWTLDVPKTISALENAIAAHRPIALLGTAFNFVHLLDRLAELRRRLPLPEETRLMETGGYKGRSRSLPKAELHQKITERLGIPPTHVVSEYGMTELSSQAYDSKVPAPGAQVEARERVFHFPPWARVQIISPETGEQVSEGATGLLRVCDLANLHSVLAVQIEDLAVRRGAGFEVVGRAAAAEPRGCSLMTA